jgi:oxygen-independent coproporphyrinogen-3 oxidase
MKESPAVRSGLGLYCHVPFCATACEFCAFYQEKPRRGDLERYLRAMELEFALLPERLPVTTVFWGGGTPGLLPARDLERLGRAMLDRLPGPPAEWTVEMAPSTVKADKLTVLRDLGVTRVSMGVQTFDPRLLEALGRMHAPRKIFEAWDLVRAAGFPRVNLDLMFALPGQTLEQWEADLRRAASLGPDHLSTYCLTFEEDTALYLKLSRGQVSRDEARELAFYERGWDLLGELGYGQYEVSNFARPGAECLHNLNTWRMGEWIGCGPSAASQFGGARYRRPADLRAWADSLGEGRDPKEETVLLDDHLLFADAVIFGLRMNAGVDIEEIARRFPVAGPQDNFSASLKRFESEGWLDRDGSRIRLTRQGRLLADAIAAEVLEILPTPSPVSSA